ncbi:ATP synthase F0 subunit B [Taibaiella sp. KBW10]|uniref:F0F1 ATP synthase subunit B n=1 Tax=Taibaiella sp. KBW10 TaxID=2153357 RepID=UPI000F5AFE2F|nr:F0F1 ATP synthase subunit B [Taibaiella sp. KBW10]RQO31271.1 ATP synthase F0 subunit B [Taibaiella sp. KBW10]
MGLITPALGLFIWTLVAFLIVLFILKKFAWKPILKMLNERETGIANAISSAEKVKIEMAEMQADNQRLIQEAREERSIMLKEAKETKDKIISEAKEQAKAEANKIMEEARTQIELKKNAALTEVKNEIGTMAVAVAEKVLRKKLEAADAQADYIKMLSEEIKLN